MPTTMTVANADGGMGILKLASARPIPLLREVISRNSRFKNLKFNSLAIPKRAFALLDEDLGSQKIMM